MSETAFYDKAPPTLSLQVTPDRDYVVTLQQTKIVYNQLLADKQEKLCGSLMAKKSEIDQNCNQLSKKDRNKAIELGVRGQETLYQLQQQFGEELKAQQGDYQSKLNKMRDVLEEKWRKEHK